MIRRIRKLDIAINKLVDEARDSFTIGFVLAVLSAYPMLAIVFQVTLLCGFEPPFSHTLSLTLRLGAVAVGALIAFAHLSNTHPHYASSALLFSGLTWAEYKRLAHHEYVFLEEVVSKKEYDYLVTTWTRNVRPMQVIRRVKFRRAVSKVNAKFGAEHSHITAFLLLLDVPLADVLTHGPVKVKQLIDSGVSVDKVGTLADYDIDTSLFGSLIGTSDKANLTVSRKVA
jgi:hypothetical protein